MRNGNPKSRRPQPPGGEVVLLRPGIQVATAAPSTLSPTLPSTPRLASTRHDLMTGGPPSFDIVNELATNRDAYTGDQWIAVHALPSTLRTSLERVRTAVGRCDPRPQPGIAAVIAACVAYGLDTLRAHPHVAATLEIKERLHTLESVDAEAAEEMALWLRTFPLALPDASTTGARRINITLPSYTKIELSDVSNDLGVSMSNLIVLCACIALAEQPGNVILDDRRREMQESVEKFYRRLRIRREVSLGWLRALGG